MKNFANLFLVLAVAFFQFGSSGRIAGKTYLPQTCMHTNASISSICVVQIPPEKIVLILNNASRMKRVEYTDSRCKKYIGWINEDELIVFPEYDRLPRR